MHYLLIYVSPFLLSGIPWGIHLITRLHCSILQQCPFQGFAYYSSADFSQFVVTTDLSACETSRILRHPVRHIRLISGFCSSDYDFAIPSSRLYLTVQTLGVAVGFVGNYAPCGLSPQTDGMPVIRKKRSTKAERIPFPITADTRTFLPARYF